MGYIKREIVEVILLLLQLARIVAAEQSTTLQTCCKFQGAFDGKVCGSESESTKYFPRLLKWSFLNDTSNSIAYEHDIILWKNVFDFRCDKEAKNLVVTKEGTENNSHPKIVLDGYLQVGNTSLTIPPTGFCVNRISTDNETLEIFLCDGLCSGDGNLCLPKCCPWGQMSRWLHPELCYSKTSPDIQKKSTFSDNAWTSPKFISYFHQPLRCINQAKMVSTRSIDLLNETDIALIKEQLKQESFCIDDVITTHDASFDWDRHKALFYCEDYWPYDEFQLTKVEKALYAGCLALSLICLMLSIAVYYIKLRRTHCNVHTWIEFFYMISVFLLALFCMLQVYFPEDQNNFCTPYHFFSVSGYVLFAISHVSWSTILSYELFYAFNDLRPLVGGIKHEKDRRRLCIYSWTGFIFPIVITVSTFYYSYYYWGKAGYCIPVQFSVMRSTQGVLLFINTICFIATIRLIIKHRRVAKLARGGGMNCSRKLNQLISCFLKLYLICGITYVGVIIGYVLGSGRSTDWYLICYRVFLNLRGVSIFFVYICNKKMKDLVFHYLSRDTAGFCDCCICTGGSIYQNPNRLLSRSRMQSTLQRTDTFTSS